MRKKLLCLLLVSAVGLTACTSNKSTKSTEKVEATATPASEEEVVDYTYTFNYSDYELPDYDATKIVKLKNYKKGTITVSGYKKEYSKADMEALLDDYIYNLSSIDESAYEIYQKGNDCISCSLLDIASYKKAKAEDSSVKKSSYTQEDVLIEFSQLDKSTLKLIKAQKTDEPFELPLNGVTYKCTIDSFGKFVEFKRSEFTDDWVSENTEYKTVKALKKGYLKQLNLNSKYYTFNSILNYLMETCEVTIPDELLQYYLNQELYSEEVIIENKNKYTDINDYLEQNKDGESLDDYVQELADTMVTYLKPRLILEAIVKKNNVKISKFEEDDFWDYSFKTDGSDYEDLESYKYSLSSDEKKYNFKYVYAGLMWCRENLNIKYKD